MGPVGILCVQRTLEKGRATGFFTGVGASISDLFYCLLTGFGLSFIEGFLKANQSVIQIFGSVVLILFGIYLFKSHPARKIKKPNAERSSTGKNVLGGFLFTISNPLIIFLIIGLFARFEFFLPEISFGLYVIGYVFIIIGALFWWWIVTFFVDKVRAHFNLRSMWLINRITGAIIMIFAVVGIITAFTSSAKAAGPRILYLNSTRGFGSLDPNRENRQSLVVTNEKADTAMVFLSLDKSHNFDISFRAANLNNASGKKYKYNDFSGKTMQIKNPGWGIILKNSEKSAQILVSTSDPRHDDLMPVTLDFNLIKDGFSTDKMSLDSGVDFFTGFNSFTIRGEGERLSFLTGNRALHPVFENIDCGFIPDSIGFFVTPGASLKLDYISLRLDSDKFRVSENVWSHFAMPEVRMSYFSQSSDPMEGEWEIFDRMLDDDELRMGGSYRLACIKSKNGYDLVYIDGAVKNSGLWKPGMLKASFTSTSFPNVYDVKWSDPSGSVIDSEIKAQFNAPDVINLQFPDHNSSSLRLRKIKTNKL